MKADSDTHAKQHTWFVRQVLGDAEYRQMPQQQISRRPAHRPGLEPGYLERPPRSGFPQDHGGKYFLPSAGWVIGKTTLVT